MRVELVIHLENTDDGEIVWWAESPDVPGFSAAAPSLAQLREQAIAALRDTHSAAVRIVERLAGGSVQRSPDGQNVRVVTTEPVAC